MTILRADSITKVYGSKRGVQFKAIDQFSLSIEKGELVAIMGASGSGKTTLLNLLSTIDKPSSGSIFIKGEEVTRLPQHKLAKHRRTEMGFVFQDFNLLDTLTIGENILLPLTLENVAVKEMEKRLGFVSRQLGIDTILRNRVYEVSGGQMQRASLARAIIHNPAIVFADEPTGNLDSTSSRQVMEALRLLHQEQEATILMVTHDPFAASFCEKVIFIQDGRLFNEIYQGESRQQFFQEVLHLQSLAGGDTDDLQTVRIQ